MYIYIYIHCFIIRIYTYIYIYICIYTHIIYIYIYILLRGGRVLSTEMLLPRIARRLSNFNQRISSKSSRNSKKLELIDSSSMRVSNRIIAPSEDRAAGRIPHGGHVGRGPDECRGAAQGARRYDLACRGKRLHTAHQSRRLGKHRGFSAASSNDLSLFSCMFQRIVTCPVDFQWHFPMEFHFCGDFRCEIVCPDRRRWGIRRAWRSSSRPPSRSGSPPRASGQSCLSTWLTLLFVVIVLLI